MNFNLLAHIIEKALGMEYAKYIEENIFKPLGMANSYVPNEGQIIPNLAPVMNLKKIKLFMQDTIHSIKLEVQVRYIQQ